MLKGHYHSFLSAMQYSAARRPPCLLCLVRPLLMDSRCLHGSVVVNSAAVNTGMHVSFYISFLWIYAQKWAAESCDKSIFSFFRKLDTVPLIVGTAVHTPTNGADSPFRTPLQPALLVDFCMLAILIADTWLGFLFFLLILSFPEPVNH